MNYFSHDSNARNDQKMVAVRMKYGIRGYGIFFCLVEMLREASKYSLKMDWDGISFDIREPKEDIKDIVLNYGLFKNNGKVFWSETLKNRMVKMEEVSRKRAEAGARGGSSKC